MTSSLRHSSPALFFTRQEKTALTRAIEQAEKKTSAEIRLHLVKSSKLPALEEAKLCFEKLGMTETEQKNGVLLLLLIKNHEFAIIGDTGIHEKLPVNYWENLVREAEVQMQNNHLAQALILIIHNISEKLAEYFPATSLNPNELSDAISHE